MNSYAQKFKFFLKALLDIIFPIECLGCGVAGQWLCKNCHAHIELRQNFCCPDCGLSSNFGSFCTTCQSRHSLSGILSAVDYHNNLVQQSIKIFKYRFVSSLGEELSFFLGQGIEKAQILCSARHEKYPQIFMNWCGVLLLPVPLHQKRRRWRGFNQAEILAEAFLKIMPMDYDATSLRRIRYTKPQANLKREERLFNLKNSFIWQGGSLTNRRVILIDDVATTGATLEECARALKAAGACEIWGLVIAKG